MSKRTSSKKNAEQGFSLFEVLIASLIMSVAVAGLMSLHARTLQDVGANAELQRVYWILSNAQQRFEANGQLTASDKNALQSQANVAGLQSVQIVATGSHVGLKWQAWNARTAVSRGGCSADSGFSCIQVQVK